MLLGKLDSYMQKNQMELLSYTWYKNKLKKRIKDLNVIPEIIKLLEENIGSTFSDILSSIFGSCLLRQWNKWDYLKLNKKPLHSKWNYQQN